MRRLLCLMLCSFAIAYLLAAFAIWSLNPAGWQESERLGTIALGGFITLLTAMADR